MFTPVILGTALFLYVMEMWSRTHPDPAQARAAQADTVEWVDRFEVPDSGAELPEVRRYLAFVAQSGSSGGLIHNYINRGLRLLNHALWGVSGMQVKVGETDRMQHVLARYIDTLEAAPRRSLDPYKVVPAFLMALEIMDAQNADGDPEVRRKVQAAREAALVLYKGPSTLWQRAKVQEFFIRAGIALVALKVDKASPRGPERPESPGGAISGGSAGPGPAAREGGPDDRIPVRAGKQPEPRIIFGRP
jgi:hypothetical protein